MRGRIRTTCKLKENAVPSLYLSGDIPVIKGMLLKRAEVKGSVLVLKDIKKENIENLAGNVATAGTENKQSLDAISSNIATAAINIDTLATNVATAGAENKISLDSLSGKT